MKSCKLCWSVSLLLLVFIAVMAYKFIVVGNTVSAPDGRTAVLMTSGERSKVLGEMRGFLEHLQGITEAISRDDMPAVAALAGEIGSAKANGETAAFMAKLPLEFKTLGLGAHAAFDDLATVAAQGGDSKAVLAKLGDVMVNCTTCHAAYSIEITE